MTNITRRAVFNFKCMQCGEGVDEAKCDGGGCVYVGSIGNDGGSGKEKNHHNHTANTTNITITTTKQTVG